MLPTLATTLRAEIAANRAAMPKLDRIGRIRLLPFTDRLVSVLHRIETAAPAEYPELETLLGETMRGPEVDDWITQSQRIRKSSQDAKPHCLAGSAGVAANPTGEAGATNLPTQSQRIRAGAEARVFNRRAA